MNLGMPTLIELKDLCACAELCAALGLTFIEVNMNMPAYQLEYLDAAEMRTIQNEYGIGFTFHLDENMDVSDYNPAVRKAYVDTACGTIRLAREIGAPVVNMHMARGVYFTLPDGIVYLHERYCEEYTASLRAFRDACAEAAGCGVQVMIENSGGFLPFQRRGIELLLENPVFGLTIDVGHDYCAQHADAPFYAAHEGKVRHMHLHDVRNGHSHLALGMGEIDAGEWLRLARDGAMRVVLETKTIEGLEISARYALGVEGIKW